MLSKYFSVADISLHLQKSMPFLPFSRQPNSIVACSKEIFVATALKYSLKGLLLYIELNDF